MQKECINKFSFADKNSQTFMEKAGVWVNQQNENNSHCTSNEHALSQKESHLRSLKTASILRTHTRIEQSKSQGRQDLMEKSNLQTEMSNNNNKNENSNLHMHHHQQVLKHPFSRLFTTKDVAFEKNISSFKRLTTFLNLKKVLQDRGLKMFEAVKNTGQDIAATGNFQKKQSLNKNTSLAGEELEKASEDHSRNSGRIQLSYKEVHGREDDSPGGRHNRRLKRQKIIGDALLKKIEQRYKEEKMAHPQNTFLNSIVNSLGQELSKKESKFNKDETQNEGDPLLESILEAEKQVKEQYQQGFSFHWGQMKEKDTKEAMIQRMSSGIMKDTSQRNVKLSNINDQKNRRNKRISVSQHTINYKNNSVSMSNLGVKEDDNDDDSLIESQILNRKKQENVDKLQIFHQLYKEETDKLIFQAKIKSQRILNKKYMPEKLKEIPMKRQRTTSPSIKSISNVFITDSFRFSEKLGLENSNNSNQKNQDILKWTRNQEKQNSFSQLQPLILPRNQSSQRNQHSDKSQNQSETSFMIGSQQRSHSQHNDEKFRRQNTQNVRFLWNNQRNIEDCEDYAVNGQGLQDIFQEQQVPGGVILNLGQSQIQGRQNLIKLKNNASNPRNTNKFMIVQELKPTTQNTLLRDDRKNNFSLQSFNSSESFCSLEKSPQKRNINSSSILENQIVSIEKIIDSCSVLDRAAFRKDFTLIDRMKSISHHLDTRLPDFQLASSVGGVDTIEKPSFLRLKHRKL